MSSRSSAQSRSRLGRWTASASCRYSAAIHSSTAALATSTTTGTTKATAAASGSWYALGWKSLVFGGSIDLALSICFQVNGSKSCANDDCKAGNYLLYDLSTDLGERTNVAAQNPEILQSMITNLTEWYASVQHSIQNESMCPGNSPSGGGMGPLGPPGNSSACTWVTGRLNGGGGPSNFIQANATSKEECCGLCANTHGCVASVYYGSKLAPSPTLQACNLRDNYRMAEGKYLVCVQPKANRLDKTAYSSG